MPMFQIGAMHTENEVAVY